MDVFLNLQLTENRGFPDHFLETFIKFKLKSVIANRLDT